MSAHLQWTVTQNCSSFPIKRNRQAYDTKPNNLKAHNSFCYSRLIRHTTAGMEPAASGTDVWWSS
ncbi:60S ribosomal protein L28-like [Phyllostomus hastatus]|uniref:60S ribosomal protein L28-like n=1 Tax=Phyllostomus hastatus TaxID=9423 RepID=UPI001E67E1DB|nr:60S ribosomal protein L28-like [Phyllostomus hastatus]